MRKYEAMCIVKPTLNEEDKKALFAQINDAVTKNNGTVAKAGVWAEKHRLFFPLKRHTEGTYYLMDFTADPSSIAKIQHIYKLNENILRILITVAP